jgi:hypothetical protein
MPASFNQTHQLFKQVFETMQKPNVLPAPSASQ